MQSISASAAAITSPASAMAASSAQPDIMYAIAVYHPLPGKYKLVGDYDLPASRLRQMDLAGVPVTLEHAGIHEAVAALSIAKLAPSGTNVGAALDVLGSDEPHKRPVGAVLCHWEGRDQRWYCLLTLSTSTPSVLLPLIRLGALRGVSLTHVCDTTTPLELSLCVRPARPECHIIRVSANLQDQLAYMRSLINPPSMTEPTPLEKAVAALAEPERALVTARFADLIQAVDTAKKAAQAAKEEAERAQSGKADVNMAVVAAQIKSMAQQLNPKYLETYYCEPETLINEMSSMDPAQLLRATDRMLCACTKQMMDLRSQTADPPAPSRKRSHSATEEAAPADPLTRALAATFELE